MENPICISTGPIKFTDDLNEELNVIKKFDIDGVELSFKFLWRLKKFNPSIENKEWLKSLKYNSVHAPWREPFGEEELTRFEQIYKEFNCHNMVFHCSSINNFNSILNKDFKASIENGDKRKTMCRTPEEINELLNKHPELNFTLDLAHANSLGYNFNDFKNDKIVEIHLSILNEDCKHCFFHNNPRPLMIKSNAPIVLEAAVKSRQDLELMKKDVEYVRNA